MNTYISVLLVAGLVSLVGYFWLAIVAFKRSVPWGLLVLLLSPLTAIVFSLVHWFEARKAFLVYIISFLLCAGSAVFISGDVGMGNMQQIASGIQSGQLTPAKAYQVIVKALGHPGSTDLFADAAPPASANASLARVSQDPPKPLTTKPATGITQGQVQLAAASSEPGAKIHAAPRPVATTADSPTSPQAAADPTVTDKTKNATQETKKQSQKPKEDANKEKAETQTMIPDINKVQPDPLAQKPKKPEPNTISVPLDKMSHYIGHYFIIKLKTGSEQRGLLRKVSDGYLILDRKLYGGNFQYKIRNGQIKSIHMLTRLPDER